MRMTLFLRIIQNRKSYKIPVYSLDYYNKTIIKSIMENGYWEYHQEVLENAFNDIDSLIETQKHAW